MCVRPVPHNEITNKNHFAHTAIGCTISKSLVAAWIGLVRRKWVRDRKKPSKVRGSFRGNHLPTKYKTHRRKPKSGRSTPKRWIHICWTIVTHNKSQPKTRSRNRTTKNIKYKVRFPQSVPIFRELFRHAKSMPVGQDNRSCRARNKRSSVQKYCKMLQSYIDHWYGKRTTASGYSPYPTKRTVPVQSSLRETNSVAVVVLCQCARVCRRRAIRWVIRSLCIRMQLRKGKNNSSESETNSNKLNSVFLAAKFWLRFAAII